MTRIKYYKLYISIRLTVLLPEYIITALENALMIEETTNNEFVIKLNQNNKTILEIVRINLQHELYINEDSNRDKYSKHVIKNLSNIFSIHFGVSQMGSFANAVYNREWDKAKNIADSENSEKIDLYMNYMNNVISVNK